MKKKWEIQYFPSGTTIVTSKDAGKPHLYVYGPKIDGPVDEDGENLDSLAARYKLCNDLQRCINSDFKYRPYWLEAMERKSESVLVGKDGSSVFATGPYYDIDPPSLCWRERSDPEAQDMRARLIDRLMGISATESSL